MSDEPAVSKVLQSKNYSAMIATLAVVVSLLAIAVGWYLQRNPLTPSLVVAEVSRARIIQPLESLPDLEVNYLGEPVTSLTSLVLELRNAGSADLNSPFEPSSQMCPRLVLSLAHDSTRVLSTNISSMDSQQSPVIQSQSSGNEQQWHVQSLRRGATVQLELLLAHESTIDYDISFEGSGYHGRLGEYRGNRLPIWVGMLIVALVAAPGIGLGNVLRIERREYKRTELVFWMALVVVTVSMAAALAAELFF